MKVPFTTLLLLALSSRIVNACDVDMPNIMLSVQFTGRAALGSQQSTELVIPLYSDCNYEHQADPVQANGGSAPNTAVSANFPADSFGFIGLDKLPLNSQALNSFLQALSSDVGRSVEVDAALSLVVCTVTPSAGTPFNFGVTSSYVFEGGAPIDIASYQCAVIFGA